MRTSTMLLNGAATLKGTGLNHRHLDQSQRTELAAAVVTGERPFVPSGEQACVIFGIPRYALTKRLKARRENGGNGNGANTPVAALEKTVTTLEVGWRAAANDVEVSVEETAASNTPLQPSYDDLSPVARCIVGVLNPAPYDDRIAALRYLGASMLWDALSALESEARSTE